MPYIAPKKRDQIFFDYPALGDGVTEPREPATAFIQIDKIDSAGDLNFAITKMVKWYLDHITGHRYQYYNEVVGVLECVKLELYRRIISEYENEKIEENGDVY